MPMGMHAGNCSEEVCTENSWVVAVSSHLPIQAFHLPVMGNHGKWEGERPHGQPGRPAPGTSAAAAVAGHLFRQCCGSSCPAGLPYGMNCHSLIEHALRVSLPRTVII